MSKKRLKYRPLRENETLDISLALSQASALLDEAVAKAKRTDDAELLLAVTDRWIAIASLFSGDSNEPDEHVDTDAEFQQYGFVYEKKDKDEVKDIND